LGLPGLPTRPSISLERLERALVMPRSAKGFAALVSFAAGSLLLALC
jgi:hypothetical protein